MNLPRGRLPNLDIDSEFGWSLADGYDATRDAAIVLMALTVQRRKGGQPNRRKRGAIGRQKEHTGTAPFGPIN